MGYARGSLASQAAIVSESQVPVKDLPSKDEVEKSKGRRLTSASGLKARACKHVSYIVVKKRTN